MTTNQPSPAPANEPAPDATDLLATLRITKTEPRANNARGTWVTGTIDRYRFEALVFPEHAESESYELGDSRISKLYLRDCSAGTCAANFERGWDIEPVDHRADAVMALLAAGLAETVFGK